MLNRLHWQINRQSPTLVWSGKTSKRLKVNFITCDITKKIQQKLGFMKNLYLTLLVGKYRHTHKKQTSIRTPVIQL